MAYTTVEVLLEELWDRRIPIDPEDFAEKLGLKVEMADDLGMKSGHFNAETKTITVNSAESREVQRLAIAHELGHYCLGHGSSCRDQSKPDWFVAKQEQEAEADRFARELLMPKAALRYFVEDLRENNPTALRKAFGVTSQALYCRLKSLGYFAR